MFPIPGLPNPYVLLGAAVLIMASFFIGHHYGYAAEHDKFVSFQGAVKATGELAEAQHQATIANHVAVTERVIADSDSKLAALQIEADKALKAQQEIHAINKQEAIKETQNEYDRKISAVHTLYAGRLLGTKSNSSSSGLSGISLTTPPAYDQSSYDLLAKNCAITTEMLIDLQMWVAAEEAVK